MNTDTELTDNELAVVSGVRGVKKNEQMAALRDALLHGDPRATILAVALVAVLLLALSIW